MRSLIFFLAFLHLGVAQPPAAWLRQLMEGNERYRKDQMLHPNHSSDRREEIAVRQTPFAAIVGCSDSRVAPEILFDQGLGDLFIIRVAGNVVGPIELNSIDYAIEHLGASVLLVLGHESCGAVTAVMDGQTADIEEIAQLIKPAIQGTKTLEEAIKANVRWTVTQLKQTGVVKAFLAKKKIECVGGYYHLGTGQVELLYEE